MTSVRIRTCAAGAAVAVLAGVLIDHGAFFGTEFSRSALLGTAVGAVLGLVPHRSAGLRLAGFGAGFAAAWLGYLVRAGLLPDIPLGRALAAVLVISVITAVATATADRVPLWAGLLGGGALIGAFEETYLRAPGDVVGESTVAATTTLLAVAFGFVVTYLVSVGLPERTTAITTTTGAAHAAPETDVEETRTITLLEDDDRTTPSVPGPRVTSDAPTASETSR